MPIDAVLDQLPCGFVAYTDDGTVTEVNTTLATMLGYTRVELLGWHVQKLFAAGARIFHQTHVVPLVNLHGWADEIFISLQKKDGQELPMLMNAARRTREEGAVIECVFLRMSQRSAFEEKLLEARRTAEEANASKAKFLSMMSHDLRTPLNAISGYAKLLAAGIHGPLTAEQHEVSQRIVDIGSDLTRLINDILSFSQLDSGRIEVLTEPVSLKAAVTRAESVVRGRIVDAGLSFEHGGVGDEVAVADADRLQQVLLNLLTNAAKFTPRGGTIRMFSGRRDTEVWISVADDGIGIGADDQAKVFEPFVQLESHRARRGDGVGLGLAISRDLVRAMGGDWLSEATPAMDRRSRCRCPQRGSDPLSSGAQSDTISRMTEYVGVTCPYCGEPADLDIDETGASRQSYVQDCPVCCQPWQVDISRDRDGDWQASLRTGDE